MAEATALVELATFSPSGDGERPAGEAMEVGRMKSSRFMGSMATMVEAGWRGVTSADWRSWAMPLGFDEGAVVGCFLRSLAFWFGSSAHTYTIEQCGVGAKNSPIALEFHLAQIHGHHPPSQVFHALGIGQLGPGLAVELPDLGGQRILLLHFLWRFDVSPHIRKAAVPQHATPHGVVSR